MKEDFKIEVGSDVMVSSDYKNSRYAGNEVTVLATFVYEHDHYAVVAAEGGCIMVEQDQLLPPLTKHEKKVKHFIKQYKPVIQRMKSDLGVTQEELAEFLISKQNKQETK